MMELRDRQPRTPATRYSDETKELAYQLWAFLTGRNSSEVARQMIQEEYGSIEVTKDTIAYWAREYGWADRAQREIQSIAPDLRYQAFSELLFAGLDGAKYIRRVNAGQEEPNKVRAMLAIAAVDRIGFSPIGKGTPGVEAPAEKVTAPDFDNMTIDQLRAYELSIRKSRSG